MYKEEVLPALISKEPLKIKAKNNNGGEFVLFSNNPIKFFKYLKKSFGESKISDIVIKWDFIKS